MRVQEMSASLNEIYKAIGALTAQVEAISDSIEASAETAVKSAEKADGQRAVMHRRIDELAHDLSELKADLQTVQSDVVETKAVTDDVVRWKQIGIGALGATGMAAAAVSSLITYKWTALVNWFMGR